MDELSKVWSDAASDLYQQPGAGAQPGQQPEANGQQSNKSGDGAVNAEYEVIDGDDK
jgi:molecular chaperone DnaK